MNGIIQLQLGQFLLIYLLLLVVLLFFNVLDTPLIFLREKLLDGLSWLLTPVVRGLTKLLL